MEVAPLHGAVLHLPEVDVTKVVRRLPLEGTAAVRRSPRPAFPPACPDRPLPPRPLQLSPATGVRPWGPWQPLDTERLGRHSGHRGLGAARGEDPAHPRAGRLGFQSHRRVAAGNPAGRSRQPGPGLWGEAAHTHLQRHGGPAVIVPVLGEPRAPLSAALPDAEAELSVSEAAWKGGGPHQPVSVLGLLLPACRGGDPRPGRKHPRQSRPSRKAVS